MPPCASASAATIDRPRPDAAAARGPRRVGAVEALEDVLRSSASMPGPASGDLEHAPAVQRRDATFAGVAGRRVRADVARAGCRRRCRSRARSPSTVAASVARSIGRSGSSACAVSTASATSSRARPPPARAAGPRRGARAGAGPRRARSSARSPLDPVHRALEVLGPLGGAAREQLGVGADGRDRRAQLVRRVRDEPRSSLSLAVGRARSGRASCSARARAGRPRSSRRRARRGARGRRRRSRRRAADRIERPQAEPDDPEPEQRRARRARRAVTSSSITSSRWSVLSTSASERRDHEDHVRAPARSRRGRGSDRRRSSAGTVR